MIVLVALLLPSTVVTVIVQVPFATAVTFPFASTVATFVLLDVHVTLLSVASAGATVAVSCTLCPACVSVAVSGVSVTPVTSFLSVYAIAYVENLSVLNLNSPVILSNVPLKISTRLAPVATSVCNLIILYSRSYVLSVLINSSGILIVTPISIPGS